MTFDPTPQIIAALLALGMALSFVLADRGSPTSRFLALFLSAVGVTIAIGTLVEVPMRHRQGVPAWGGLFAIPETFAFVFAYEWVLRVRRTIPARNLKTRFGDNQLRVAQVLALVYGGLALVYPEQRAEHFVNALAAGTRNWTQPAFLMFALPLGVSLVLGIGSGWLTLNRRPDQAERLRLVAFISAAPLMASGMVLPARLAPVATSVGLLMFLVGAVQYHVIQGRRVQFLSRFLAPQVAELVREQGLRSATREQTVQISVVCCDLRGFTAFSEATASSQVIRILREYYDAVGEAAARVGGTIKDQAGDGVLILVGAPIAFADHAHRALTLAREIRARGLELTQRWSDGELQLGVGVGVASGFVTAGVIGAASRLEYTAVGPAVNLAARLCAEASHGEVLVDSRTHELAGGQDAATALRPGNALTLKGFPQPVPCFVMAAG